jgi:glycerol-3-phosphate O-acyltransferase/dihydroxyacetone phosphate acyltransferase
MLYPLFRLLARLALRLFFRRIEIEGRELVPLRGPVLLVPNHTNAFVDPLLLVISLRRRVTLTAKNVLAKNPLFALLMRGLGVVTFHRREDLGKGAVPKENLRSLDLCRRILQHGGAVCIFPEGISHSDPHLRPFRSGAARLAMDLVNAPAAGCFGSEEGRLKIVPVGLLYTEKDRFRSDVWLRFGTPLDVGDWLAEHRDAAANELTEEIRRRIEELTVTFQTRRESVILTRGADILAAGGVDPAPLGWRERSVAENFQLLKRLQAGYLTLRQSRPEEIEALTRQVRDYHLKLRRLGIEPREVYLPLHWGKASFFVFRELELLLAGAPLALFGAVNHLLPYIIVKRIARALSRDKDHWATNVVYPSFAVFPLCYALQIAAAWLLLPAFWAALYTVALPYTGYIAILYGERAGGAWRRLRTFLYWYRRPLEQEELARTGREIIAHIRDLGEQAGQVHGTSRAAADICATEGNRS